MLDEIAYDSHMFSFPSIILFSILKLHVGPEKFNLKFSE